MKALIAMSGGVDSSVAYRLGIPYYVFNFQDAFRQQVIAPFIRSYTQGLTPNPCLNCNRYVKFDQLYHRAQVLGCDYLVIERQTGHQFPTGAFVDTTGHVVGQHRGIIHYTVGQRKGLGLSAPRPLYVCQICPNNNTVVVGEQDALRQTTAYVTDLHWINSPPATPTLTCRVKVRYHHPEQPATVYLTGDHTAKIVFDAPQRAITPGQAAVLYQGDTVLGGGIITPNNTTLVKGDLIMLYSEQVMDHFRNPRNVGEMPDADGIGEVGNAKCGDIMRMYIKVKDDIITDVKFMTFGCGSAIATSSIATEMIKGKPISEALTLTNQAVVKALNGLPAHKLHCSVLAEAAVKAAVKDYYDRHGIVYDATQFGNSDGACCHGH